MEAAALKVHHHQLVLVMAVVEEEQTAIRCSAPEVEVQWVLHCLQEQGCPARTPCQRLTWGEEGPWYRTGWRPVAQRCRRPAYHCLQSPLRHRPYQNPNRPNQPSCETQGLRVLGQRHPCDGKGSWTQPEPARVEAR